MNLTRIDARLLSRPGATKALHEKWGLWSTGLAAGSSPASSPPRPTPRRPTRGATCCRSSATPTADADLPEKLVLDLCDMSYDLVFAKLPKRVQREVSGG